MLHLYEANRSLALSSQSQEASIILRCRANDSRFDQWPPVRINFLSIKCPLISFRLCKRVLLIVCPRAFKQFSGRTTCVGCPYNYVLSLSDGVRKLGFFWVLID